MSGGIKCRICNVPHAFTAELGWRADNGKGLHAYDKRTNSSMKMDARDFPPLKVVHDAPPPASASLDYEVLFGNWAFCRACGASTSNTAAGMASHRALHAELEQLRVDVDRLTRIINRGGGAA